MELDNVEQKIRKLMTMHHALHPESNTDQPRAKESRRSLHMKQTMEEERHDLNETTLREAKN